ncbi:hypothetical protein VULLAG_LOCUS20964 [Vulpes lagopus]
MKILREARTGGRDPPGSAPRGPPSCRRRPVRAGTPPLLPLPARPHRAGGLPGSATGSRVGPRHESSRMVVAGSCKLQARGFTVPLQLLRSRRREDRACTEAEEPELDPALRPAQPTRGLLPASAFAPGTFSGSRARPRR